MRSASAVRCALCAPLQEIAETVSRALAYLTDRLSWPYCLQVTAYQCVELYDNIERAQIVYQRYAKRHAANKMLSVPVSYTHLTLPTTPYV